jgi:PAS domain S-box-containing protein
MTASASSPHEVARLRVLHRHAVPGGARDPAFDDLVDLVALTLRVPIALVALLDRERQWFLARHGLMIDSAPRAGSLCARVVEEGRTLVVPDALADPRYATAAMVVDEPHLRFYAGVPLTTRDGFVLGSLCVLDHVPRELDSRAIQQLELFGRQTVALLEQTRRLRSAELSRTLAEEAGNLFFVVDLAGRVQEHGDNLPSMVGEDELIGRPIAELLPREGPRVMDELARLRAQEDAGAESSTTSGRLDVSLDAGGRLDFLTQTALDEGLRARAWHLALDRTTNLVHVLAVDVSPQVRARTRAKTAGEMLRVIGDVQRRWITGARTQELFDELLGQFLRLSGSAYGFLAELQIEGDVEARVVVRNRALAGANASPECRQFYDGLDDLDERHLFVRVLDTRAPVIVNDTSGDPNIELPPDHPPVRSFLGLPFLEGRRLIGMVGLANAPDGYDADTVAYLEPFVSTGANLLAAHRLAQRRRASERALAESEARLRAIVDTAVDAIVTVDASARIERANPAVTRLFGYQPMELIGTPFTHLVGRLPLDPSVLEAPQSAGRLPGQLETWVLGVTEEILGIRSDGSCFPLEIAISQMWLGERRMFTAIIRDATERRRIDSLRSEFVSTVSHELRTPLTSIRGSLGLLAGGVAGDLPGRAVQMVGIALSNCERLSRLIDDLLDIEKIESGRLEFSTIPLVLFELLGETLEVNTGFALAHATSFELEVASELNEARVLADPGRLAQVVANLLSNAAKFSANKPVTVSMVRAGNGLRVTVRDRGPGVPENVRDRIFQRFTQAEDETARKRRGTGLGLSIAKAIIERLGGAIGYRPAEGGGSCFWFELPEHGDPLG